MDRYSDEEKFEMLLIYEKSKRNAVTAQQLYAEGYPNKIIHHVTCLSGYFEHLSLVQISQVYWLQVASRL